LCCPASFVALLAIFLLGGLSRFVRWGAVPSIAYVSNKYRFILGNRGDVVPTRMLREEVTHPVSGARLGLPEYLEAGNTGHQLNAHFAAPMMDARRREQLNTRIESILKRVNAGIKRELEAQCVSRDLQSLPHISVDRVELAPHEHGPYTPIRLVSIRDPVGYLRFSRNPSSEEINRLHGQHAQVFGGIVTRHFDFARQAVERVVNMKRQMATR